MYVQNGSASHLSIANGGYTQIVMRQNALLILLFILCPTNSGCSIVGTRTYFTSATQRDSTHHWPDIVPYNIGNRQFNVFSHSFWKGSNIVSIGIWYLPIIPVLPISWLIHMFTDPTSSNILVYVKSHMSVDSIAVVPTKMILLVNGQEYTPSYSEKDWSFKGRGTPIPLDSISYLTIPSQRYHFDSGSTIMLTYPINVFSYHKFVFCPRGIDELSGIDSIVFRRVSRWEFIMDQ